MLKEFELKKNDSKKLKMRFCLVLRGKRSRQVSYLKKIGLLGALANSQSPLQSSAGISNPLAPTNQGPQPWPSFFPPNNYSPNYSSTGCFHYAS